MSRRLPALLALSALLLHGLLPLTAQAIHSAQAASGIELTVLCSANGIRVVALQDGQPVDADPTAPERAAEHCPLCSPPAGPGAAVLPAAASIRLPQTAAAAIRFSPHEAPAGTVLAGRPPAARAPPVLSC